MQKETKMMSLVIAAVVALCLLSIVAAPATATAAHQGPNNPPIVKEGGCDWGGTHYSKDATVCNAPTHLLYTCYCIKQIGYCGWETSGTAC